MFHQVMVQEKDKDTLIFLWHLSKDEEFQELRMNFHLFGKVTQPWFCIWALNKTSTSNISNITTWVKHAVLDNFQMDNYLDLFDAKKKKKQYKLQKALSHLPKQDISDTPSGIQWSRNLECFTLAELSPSSINLDLKDTGNERSLGILWNSCKNSFQIKVFKMEVPLTKKERFQATPVPSLIRLVFWLLLYWNQKS